MPYGLAAEAGLQMVYYYMNKLHWCTVYLDGNVPQDVLSDIVYASYKFVRSSLSKKAQRELVEAYPCDER